MIIYEVNLEVDEEVNFKFAGWLPGHMNKMLEFDGFEAAYWFFRKPEDEDNAMGKTLWTLHYIVDNRDALETYFKNHASGMRDEALQLFGDKFKVERRILNLLSVAGIPLEKETEGAGI